LPAANVNQNVGEKILLTGEPGVGKTTVIKKLAEALRPHACGFYTEEILKFGSRLGFHIVTLDGKIGLLAHVGREEGPRVGKFRVDVPRFEELALPALEEKGDVILIDEIGKMELHSEFFKLALDRIFEGERSVIATVMPDSNAFADRIKRRPDVDMFEVNRYNRTRLPAIILSRLDRRPVI
jgi:nucleoside-triphosphatase